MPSKVCSPWGIPLIWGNININLLCEQLLRNLLITIFFCHLLCQCDSQTPQAVIQRAGKISYSLAWPSIILGPEDHSPSQSHLPFSIIHLLLPPSSLTKQHGILVPAQCLRRMSYRLSRLPPLHPHLFTGGGNVHLSVLLVISTVLTGAQFWSFSFFCLSSTWLSLGLCSSPLALNALSSTSTQTAIQMPPLA